jgi:hypothetical protein
VGGSLGTALLNTIATSATATYISEHRTSGAAMQQVAREGIVHGYTHAIWWGVAAMLIAAVASGVLVVARPQGHGAPAGAGAH